MEATSVLTNYVMEGLHRAWAFGGVIGDKINDFHYVDGYRSQQSSENPAVLVLGFPNDLVFYDWAHPNDSTNLAEIRFVLRLYFDRLLRRSFSPW